MAPAPVPQTGAIIKENAMCYGICKFEMWSGECGKRAYDVCPESFETPEEYHEFMETRRDDEADYLYEQQCDREIFG